MKEATEVQLETLDFIYEYIQDNKISPAVRDISSFFNISIRAVTDRLTALEKKCYIEIETNTARGISLTDKCYFWVGYKRK